MRNRVACASAGFPQQVVLVCECAPTRVLLASAQSKANTFAWPEVVVHASLLASPQGGVRRKTAQKQSKAIRHARRSSLLSYPRATKKQDKKRKAILSWMPIFLRLASSELFAGRAASDSSCDLFVSSHTPFVVVWGRKGCCGLFACAARFLLAEISAKVSRALTRQLFSRACLPSRLRARLLCGCEHAVFDVFISRRADKSHLHTIAGGAAEVDTFGRHQVWEAFGLVSNARLRRRRPFSV